MKMVEQVKKVTKAQRFEDIKALLEGKPTVYGTDVEAAKAFIDHEQELLMKKNSSGEKKLTKTQEENVIHKGRIADFLRTQTEGVTVTQVLKGIPDFADFSNQKVARLMRDMLEAGLVKKEVVKGKSLFSLT